MARAVLLVAEMVRLGEAEDWTCTPHPKQNPKVHALQFVEIPTEVDKNAKVKEVPTSNEATISLLKLRVMLNPKL